MTLQNDDDVVKGELSIEELEAIAGGWPGWVHAAAHWVVHDLGHAFALMGETSVQFAKDNKVGIGVSVAWAGVLLFA